MTASLISRATVRTVKAHRDARGSLFEPLDDAELRQQNNVHVVLTQPKETRGNHVHQSATEVTTVVGPCLIRLKEGGELRDLQVPTDEVWRLEIPPGVVHAFRNTGDAVMLLVSFSTQVHEASAADTRREQIL